MSIVEATALFFGVIVGLALVQRMRRKEIDTERLDAVQANRWAIGQDGEGNFAVLAGYPPVMITKLGTDVRKVIDQAIEQKGVPRG